MVKKFLTLLVLITLVLFFGMPLSGMAFTAGNFTVSPQSIDIGTVNAAPGASAGPFSFNISVVGGPVPAVGETASVEASADVPWLEVVAPVSSPGSVTVRASVTESMGEGTWTGTVTILSGLDPNTPPVTVTVTMTVTRTIGNGMTVSPSTINLVMDGLNTGRQTFPVTIASSDPRQTSDFIWSAASDAAWLTLSAMSGEGGGTFSVIINPEFLTLSGDQDIDSGTHDEDTATGTITFSSILSSDPVTLTVTVKLKAARALSVSPGHLYWSFEKSDLDYYWSMEMIAGSDPPEITPQMLQVFAGSTGWSASCDVNFLTVRALDANGRDSGYLMSHDFFGRIEVTPVGSLIAGLGYGNHTGYITVSDLNSQFHRKIPVTINIRQPGQGFDLPVPSPEIYQISPYYSSVEANDTSLLNFSLPAPVSLAYYPTEQLCVSAGGQWMDIDETPGNLNEYCSLSQRIYILIEFPQMTPGLVYAWTNPGQASDWSNPSLLNLAYDNGIKIPGSDALTYAAGPVPSVPFGPLQLLGCHGTVIISMRAGSDLNSAQEVQRIQINLKTPAGQWKVTENYLGTSYTYYDTPLILSKNAGQTHYSGSWGGTPVTVLPGDGIEKLYELTFNENGIHYIYEIKKLTSNEMSGRWRLSWQGGTSTWETFSAQRAFWLP